jgi:hypothetical protein
MTSGAKNHRKMIGFAEQVQQLGGQPAAAPWSGCANAAPV